MIKAIKENSLHLLNYLDEEFELTNNWKDIQFYLIHILIIITSFLLGRYMTKKHKISEYLQSFNNSAKEFEKLQNSLYFVKILKKFACFLIFVIPLSTLLIFYFLNSEEIHEENKKLKEKLIIIKDPFNMFFIFGNILFFIVTFILFKFMNYRNKILNNEISNLTDCKTLYVEKFFDGIGLEMKNEIKKLLLNKDTQKEQEIEKYKIKNEKLNDLNIILKKKHDTFLEKFSIYKDFVDKISSFEWCELCYNISEKKNELMNVENDNKEISSLEEENSDTSEKNNKDSENEDNEDKEKEIIEEKIEKKNLSELNSDPQSNPEITNLLDSHKSTKINRLERSCLNNCLPKYLSFCEEVGKEFFNKLKIIKQD